MKRLMMIVLFLAAMLGGCNPTITQWADRGVEGLEMEARNLGQWHAVVAAGVVQERERQIGATYADTKAILAGQIKDAEGKALELTPEWLDVQQKVLVATLAALDERMKNYDAQLETCVENVERIKESFDAIKKLNKAWAGSSDTLQFQVAKLTDLVTALAKEK